MNRLIAISALAMVIGMYFMHHEYANRAIEAAVSEERNLVHSQALEELAQSEARAVKAETAATIAALEGKVERDQYQARARADASVLHGELGRLRAVLDGYHSSGGETGEGASTRSIVDDAGPLASALGQCSERYAGVAEVADRLSIQVIGLQQYITQVAGPICIAQAQP